MKLTCNDTSLADQMSAKVFFDLLCRYFDLQDARVMDLFSRNGVLTIHNYHDVVESIDAFEIEGQYSRPLIDYGNVRAVIGCAYKNLEALTKTYDVIVIDSPQGLHTSADGEVHAEHFDMLKQVGRFVDGSAVICLYCNKTPYNKAEIQADGIVDDYSEYDFDEWMKKRADFYKTCDPQDISEEFMVEAYRQCLEDQGLSVRSVVMVPCFGDVKGYGSYGFRLGLEVSRESTD